MNQIYHVQKQSAQIRLDQWLKDIFPDLGLRGIRRLILTGQILLNGQIAKPGHKLEVGFEITYKPKLQENLPEPNIIKETDDYIFFQKPANIHTVALAGGQELALENAINNFTKSKNPPILLQRLDFETSGIICAAKNEAAAEKFRQWESHGLIIKKYLAILTGKLATAQIAKQDLDLTHKLVRPKLGQAHPTRQTYFEPLAFFLANSPWPNWFKAEKNYPPLDLTLVGCTLKIGHRHQIRAHAKSLNHPLWLDKKYGEIISPKEDEPSQSFYLHQAAIFLPDAFCLLWPDWLKKTEESKFIADWLNIKFKTMDLANGSC
ncbi:MAG: hypothetical protein IJT59_01695 [Desulfovibrionaceae bacterium]|nr:hypothetical protein [Desulfovibrionaceae bacterium]